MMTWSATWTAATDADGDAVSYAYQWLRDGSPVAGQSGTTTALSVTLTEGADGAAASTVECERDGAGGFADVEFARQ